MTKFLIGLLCLFSASSLASTCKPIKHKDGEIIQIHSALRLGGRIQLPSNLISQPIVSNPHLWDVDGIVGTNQVFLKPNSELSEGEKTLIYAVTEDGKVYDIEATRTSAKANQPCVMINGGSRIFEPGQQSAITQFVTQRKPVQPTGPDPRFADQSQRIRALEAQLKQERENAEQRIKQSVVDALKKYQYRIYTRYEWNEGKHFVGRNTIADVYDDGQFTYIRLANPNRGILSVETMIAGHQAIAPTQYIDSYGMYKVTGIYPRFTLRVDNVKVEVNRRDNRTKGNT
ncbi:TrbG/VirB9 family P-type conjugative transfer protein [Vibrio sp. WXL103]|uniref:TrbG/VirB9 family P-type conjugative transfer protein n=1 Tax=unclassified Vibrio TaxID=2614977 RepID=UPI003EC88A92